ncbi:MULTISPECIES: hypothetical protein [Nocardia]|uniref:hypothetical protein n=1 Tax=Nocardia TaxID=1817 RepID=UPI002457A0A7|nr:MULTISPECIES: hypothetical protein [Nocardia]
MTAREDLTDILFTQLDQGNEPYEIAGRVIAEGWRSPARELTDPADLDALPRGSAVLTRNGRVWQKAVTAVTEWWPALGGWEKPAASEQLLGMGIVTLLHTPAEDWLRMVPGTENGDTQ